MKVHQLLAILERARPDSDVVIRVWDLENPNDVTEETIQEITDQDGYLTLIPTMNGEGEADPIPGIHLFPEVKEAK